MTTPTSPTDKSYATEAFKYVAAGWMGVLPVPYQCKKPVPTGFSGHDGKYPDREQIKAWVEGEGESNLALRLPNTVVGIDVDSYDGKKGRECLAHAEEIWGPLPETVRSTSRLDGISGIRLYRVKPGTVLRTGITFPEQGLDGIDIIQYFHRYCMAWPSTHPTTKRRYRWVNHDGMPAVTEYPLVGSLPFLPEKWLEGLSRPPEEAITAKEDVQKVVSGLTQGEPSMRVSDALDKSTREIEEATGGRHDEALRSIGRLLRLNHEDEPGVAQAMDQLETTFIRAISDRASEETAQAEWNRMLYGNRIHDKIASTPSDNKQLELILGTKPSSGLDAIMRGLETARADPDFSPEVENQQDQLLIIPDGPPALPGLDWYMGDRIGPENFQDPDNPPGDFVYVPEFDEDALLFGLPTAAESDERPGGDGDYFDEYDLLFGTTTAVVEPDDGLDEWDRMLFDEEGASHVSRTSWGVKDASEIWGAEELTPEKPTIGRRDDGACLFYPGKVNALVGPPESAKSWVAQYIASQELAKDNSVMYLDFEDSEMGVIGRMRYLGVDRDRGQERFLYADPKGPLDADSAAELFGNLDLFRPTLVIADGLGAVMALHNYEMKDNTEFIKFFQLLLEPLTRSGAAVVLIDHVSKDSDESNNYAIGAQAKLQMITGVQIKVSAVKKFGRGKKGRLRLTINKDRPGGVRETSEFRSFKGASGRGSYELDYWSTVFVDATEPPRVRMSMVFEKKDTEDIPEGDVQLQIMVDRVVEYVRDCPHRPSSQEILDNVGGNKDDVRIGLKEAKFSGRVKSRSLGAGKKTEHWVDDLTEMDVIMGTGGTPNPTP